MKATVPQRARTPITLIHVADVALVLRLHQSRWGLGFFGTEHQVDMVGHENVRMDEAMLPRCMALQPVQVETVIVVGKKAGVPIMAALNGTALGGGLEMALATHYRVAIADPKAKFGLPEVKLGLLPGGGGTQRLPRMIGIQASLPLMLEGKELSAEAAKQQGIINELATDKADMLAKAKSWCLATPKPVQPWDDKKFKWPGGDARHPAVVQVFAIAPSMAGAKTQGNYPAATNIMSCVYEGGIVDFVHLLNSWFNRGFLVLRRIDWSSPAVVLEKIIRYEAVHAIESWDR